MIQGGHDERHKEKKNKKVCRENDRVGAVSEARGRKRRVPARKHRPSTAIQMEAKVSPGRHCELKRYQARSEQKEDPATTELKAEKEILAQAQREALRAFIDQNVKKYSVKNNPHLLEVHPRAYYRWKEADLRNTHGGGGGKNKITPKEERAVVRMAKKNPAWHCRRIAYHLERNAKAFIGKAKVAEIMKAHGLNHPFEQKPAKPVVMPQDMLLHEPWRSNLLWGMDWTWITVNRKFMFLPVLLDWHSRKILSWGLYHKITQNEVVTVVAEAVASESTDLLPAGSLKPTVVADHGGANIAAYTPTNIEIQGLKLWPSGIGRPTGNARTERVIGTLKSEEIYLQEQYENEEEAYQLIGTNS